MSAHLVSIHSREEHAFIITSGNITHDHWLGMRRNSTRELTIAEKREDWHWLDGTSLNYRNWKTGEPSTNAQCAVITKTGSWDDEYCSRSHKFICKKVISQPITTTTTLAPTTTTTTTTTTTPIATITTATTTTTTTEMVSPRMTTGPPGSDWTTRHDNVTSSNTPQSSILPTTPRQDGLIGQVKSGVGLYIVVVVLAAVAAGLVLYRRRHSTKSTQSRDTPLPSITFPPAAGHELNAHEPEGVGEYSDVNKTSHDEPVGYVNTTNVEGATYVNARDVGGAGYVNTADRGGTGYVNTADSGGTGYVNTNVTNDPSHYEHVAVSQHQAQSSAVESFRQTTAEYETMTSPTTPYENIEITGVIVPDEYESLQSRRDVDNHVYEAANSQAT
ncbi:hypothetical protein LSAT2_021363 [Lamellibrachia satsuma]|nr:hypothetical protein LSAT2_021363 [Lamellibrachia satsuma]